MIKEKTGKVINEELMVNNVRRSWELFYRDGSVVEVRIFLNHRASSPLWNNDFADILSGYFDSLDALIKLIVAIEKSAAPQATYITINPINRALAGRSYNKFRGAKKQEGASDEDITERNWLMIDLDPIRTKGVSATNEEIDAAMQRSAEIVEALKDRGWPAPIILFSGNGYHLLFAIMMRNSGAIRDLLKECLLGLQLQFSDKEQKTDLGSKLVDGKLGVKLDQGVFNAGRVTKLYGTWARKGDEVDGRIHRQSRFEYKPDQVLPVPLKLIEAEADIYRSYKKQVDAEKQKEKPKGANGQESLIERFDREHPISEMLSKAAYPHAHGSRYKRPGGKSASVLVGEDGKTTHFSSSDPMFGNRHDSFDFETALHFGGDADKAIEHWAAQYGIVLRRNIVHRNGNGKPDLVNYQVKPTADRTPPTGPEKKPDPPAAASPVIVAPGDVVKLIFEAFLEKMRLRVIETYNRELAVSCLYDNENGNARLLHSVLKEFVAFDHTATEWHWYNGLYWEADDQANIYYLASEILKYYYDILSTRTATELNRMLKLLEEESNDEIAEEAKRLTTLKKDAWNRSRLLCNITNVRNSLAFAVAGERLGIRGDEWDKIERAM